LIYSAVLPQNAAFFVLTIQLKGSTTISEHFFGCAGDPRFSRYRFAMASLDLKANLKV
jgi:hypothetical protein